MNSLYENDIFKDCKVNSYVEGIAAFYGCTVEFNDNAVEITGETISSVNMAQAAIEEFVKPDFETIYTTPSGRTIRPKTYGQKYYVDSINRSELVICSGPAGSGKTFLGVAMAVKAFRAHEVSRIILTRPAVEAGERLGFLPGDMQEKVDPYLRPLYDALYDVLGIEAAARLREKGVIEVVPLAYMRGRTLDNAFIILDEAQNTTREQMKMFLTRMGFNSKVVVTGDITQIDLPSGTVSGLKEARKVLSGVEGIRFNTFSEVDVVRHELVKRIIRAYDSYDNKNRVRATTSKGNKVSDR